MPSVRLAVRKKKGRSSAEKKQLQFRNQFASSVVVGVVESGCA